MKTNGDVVTFRVTRVASETLQGAAQFVANRDMLKVVIVDHGRRGGESATEVVVGAAMAAKILADALKGAAASQ